MEKQFYKAKDVMKILDCKQSKAYDLIKELNEELATQGFKTVKGRVPIKYFNEAFGLER